MFDIISARYIGKLSTNISVFLSALYSSLHIKNKRSKRVKLFRHMAYKWMSVKF